jgi:hypothetical protein
MRRSILTAAALSGAALLGGCGSTSSRTAVTPTTTPTAATTTTTTTSTPPPTTGSGSIGTTSITAVPATTTATPVTGQSLPVSVSTTLSSPQQDTSILQPTSCTFDGQTVTAQGTFQGGLAAEGFIRYGDVVELYAYTAPSAANANQALQVIDLASESPYPIAGSGPWHASGPVDAQVGTPVTCDVAVQSTHAFMAAGDAGG